MFRAQQFKDILPLVEPNYISLLDTTFENVQNWKNCFNVQVSTRRLRITVKEAYEVDDTMIINLFKNVMRVRERKSLDKIGHFILDLSKCASITDKAVREITILIKTKLNCLKSLDINFSHCSNISHHAFQTFANDISNHLNYLQSLTLNLSSCPKVNTETAKSISEYIGSKLKTLNHLALNFSECKYITYHAAKLINLNIGRLTHLNHFDLSFYNCQNFEDIRATHLDILVFPKMHKLLSFGLDLGYCGKISLKALNDFVSQLGFQNQRLQELNLRLSNCYNLNDYVITDLSIKMPNLQKIERLKLDFANCIQISDKSLVHLISQMGTDLKNLNHLDLNLSNCNTIKDKALSKLALNIGNFNKLCDLRLNLSYCDKISNQPVKKLFSTFGKNLVHLECLRLNLTSCYLIGDQALQELVLQIKDLKQLRYLELNFSGCTDIAEQTVKALAGQIILSLTELKYVELCFSFNQTSQIKDYLKEALRAMPSIQSCKIL